MKKWTVACRRPHRVRSDGVAAAAAGVRDRMMRGVERLRDGGTGRLLPHATSSCSSVAQPITPTSSPKSTPRSMASRGHDLACLLARAAHTCMDPHVQHRYRDVVVRRLHEPIRRRASLASPC